MKTVKSLVALATAIALGFGFSSCSKKDSEPEPTVETTFNISLWINSDVLEYFDIDMQYTDADGKIVSVNILDCPEGQKEIPVDNVPDIVKYRKFTAECKSNKLPAETSIMVKYKYNGKTTADEINVGVGGSFLINKSGNDDYFRYFRGIETKDLANYANYLNEYFGTWILAVDAKGNKSYTLGRKD